MTDLTDRLRARYMDTKNMLPCALEHEAAAEIERLTAERDAAYTMSRCQCGTDEACSNLAALRREIVALQAKLKEVPRWWHCDTHGPGSHTAWGCPECVRDMRAETKALQAKHDDDKSDLLAMQRERDKLRDMLDNALLIVRDFATRNPLQTVQGHQIDPWGAHRWLDEYAARRGTT